MASDFNDSRKAVLDLRKDGFEVVPLTSAHFRVNGLVDFYPKAKRYHHLPTGARGDYDSPRSLMKWLSGR